METRERTWTIPTKQQELKNITRMKVEKARDGIYGPIRMELRYNSNTSRLDDINALQN